MNIVYSKDHVRWDLVSVLPLTILCEHSVVDFPIVMLSYSQCCFKNQKLIALKVKITGCCMQACGLNAPQGFCQCF